MKKQGYSLLELMVVVGIIGLIAALAGSSIGHYRAAAEVSEMRAVADDIMQAVSVYHRDRSGSQVNQITQLSVVDPKYAIGYTDGNRGISFFDANTMNLGDYYQLSLSGNCSLVVNANENRFDCVEVRALRVTPWPASVDIQSYPQFIKDNKGRVLMEAFDGGVTDVVFNRL